MDTLDLLTPGKQRLVQGVELVLGQYLSASVAHLGQIMAGMHKENFKKGGVESAHMEPLRTAIHLLVQEHISLLPRADLVSNLVAQCGAKVLLQYLRHVSLIKPMGDQGKVRAIHNIQEVKDLVMDVVQQGDAQHAAWKRSVECASHMTALLSLEHVSQMVEYMRTHTDVPTSLVYHVVIGGAPSNLVLLKAHANVSDYLVQMDMAEAHGSGHVQGLKAGTVGASVLELKRGEEFVWRCVSESLEKYRARQEGEEVCFEHDMLLALRDLAQA